MKKLLTPFALIVIVMTGRAQQTFFQKTNQQFTNHEYVYNVIHSGAKVGEFWPVKAINLVTKETLGKDSNLLTEKRLDTLQKRLGGVATAPDGMTVGSLGSYQLQGKALSHGIPCGDGFVYDYGLILVSSNGYNILFKHVREVSNFDSLYQRLQSTQSTLFFLPSIFREGKFLSSNKTVDKVLIRRSVPEGEQIGVMIFDRPMTYDEVLITVLGLDRNSVQGGVISKTTHIYVLDGGPTWGQSIKEVNEGVVTMGTRVLGVNTNYLVFN